MRPARAVAAVVLAAVLGFADSRAASPPDEPREEGTPGTRSEDGVPRKRRAVRHPSRPTGPVAQADAYDTGYGSPLTVAAPGVLTNDTLNQTTIVSFGVNGNEQTTLGGQTATSQAGTVSLRADGGFTYSHANGFTGADTFRYTLSGASGTSAAQVTITVIPVPPVAADDAYGTQQNTPLSQPAPGVLANDTTNAAVLVSYGASTGGEQTSPGSSTPTAQGGTVSLASNGSFTYTPANGFSGADTFRYVLENAAGSSAATVTVTVAASDFDFAVTTNGSFSYFISGFSGPNPQITLKRGRTYRFKIDAPGHPFEILEAPAGSVTNNGITSGTLTFAVPSAAQNYAYQCTIHEFMTNTIITEP